MNLRNVGINIRNIRKKLGYSQEKLAEVADCSWRYVQAIEQGNRVPSIQWLNNLAEKLKKPLSVFFKE